MPVATGSGKKQSTDTKTSTEAGGTRKSGRARTAEQKSRKTDSAVSNKRAARLDLRTTAEQKSLIEHAATLAGESLSTFVLQAALEIARRRINEENTTRLTLDEWARFCKITSSTLKPGSVLSKAAKRHDEMIADSDGL